MSKKILVLGGSGFIGREVCRKAAEEGHEVVSVSRHGRPNVNGSAWAQKVRWEKGNVLEPETWRHHLEGCHAVVHAAGILKEQPDEGLTYERIYRDSVEMAAWEAEHAGVEHFVLLSVDHKPAFVSDRFLEAKREGEAAVRGRKLRETILRPMYVVGPDRQASMVLGNVLKVAEKVPGVGASHPLRVEQVATAAVRAATEEGYEGVVNIELIEYLADGHWQPHGANRADGRSAAALLVVGGLALGLAAGLVWGLSRRR